MTGADAMRRGSRSMVRVVVVGLLMLATLLTYAVPGHASLALHHAAPAAHGHDHGPDGAAAGTADHHHEQAPCGDASGLLDDGSCCSVAQCTSMHGGLPAAAPAAFVPRLGRGNQPAALATPDGIAGDPALRPPRPTV